jgi:hypothetical protein
MIKATTKHGTYYLIDTENSRAMRVKAEDRNDMHDDGNWFDYAYFCPLERTYGASYGENGVVEVGKSIYFELHGPRAYDWRISTDVVSVEIV